MKMGFIALGAVGGFSFVILTFWGFYLLSSIHHVVVGRTGAGL